MPNETIGNDGFAYNLDSIKTTINKLAEAIDTLHSCQQITLEGCIKVLTEFAQVLSEYQEIRTQEIANSLEGFVRVVSEFNNLTIEYPEGTTKYEDTLNDLIDASPLEENQKIELKQNTKEQLNLQNPWDKRNFILSLILGILSLFVPSIIAYLLSSDSGITINIDSPTIVIEDAEAAEEYIAQISDLLDELREE